MTRQLFDDLIGTPPPSRVDVAGIVRREKRKMAARRLGGTLAAVTALAVAGGFLLSPGAGVPSTSTPVAEATTPQDLRFRLVTDTKESSEATASRLGQELDKALKETAPGAQWIFEPDIVGETGPDGVPPEIYFKQHTYGKKLVSFVGESGVLVDGRKGSLRMMISPNKDNGNPAPNNPGGVPTRPRQHVPTAPPPVVNDRDGEKPATIPSEPPCDRCVEITGPNGEKVTKIDLTYKPASGGVPVETYLVRVDLADGRELEIEVTNSFGADGAPHPKLASPLTMEQVITMATTIAGKIKA